MVTVGDTSGGRRIAELTRVVVGSPGYMEERGAPGTLSDLEAHVGISVPGTLDDWILRKGLPARPGIAFEVGDSAAALALALAGAGLAQLPRHICADAIERGALVAVLPDDGSKPMPVMAQALGTSQLPAALVAVSRELAPSFIGEQPPSFRPCLIEVAGSRDYPMLIHVGAEGSTG